MKISTTDKEVAGLIDEAKEHLPILQSPLIAKYIAVASVTGALRVWVPLKSSKAFAIDIEITK